MGLHTITMRTDVSKLEIKVDGEKGSKFIKNDGQPVKIEGVSYTLKNNILTMTSKDKEKIEAVSGFFKYDTAKYTYTSGRFAELFGTKLFGKTTTECLKSTTYSQRITNDRGSHKAIFRPAEMKDAQNKWNINENKDILDVLGIKKNKGGYEVKIEERDLGKFKRVSDISNDPEGALKFFIDKHQKEQDAGRKDDFRRILRGIEQIAFVNKPKVTVDDRSDKPKTAALAAAPNVEAAAPNVEAAAPNVEAAAPNVEVVPKPDVHQDEQSGDKQSATGISKVLSNVFKFFSELFDKLFHRNASGNGEEIELMSKSNDLNT